MGALPECMGKKQTNSGLIGVTASGPFGWNALGEYGMNGDQTKLGSDAFELHEYGYSGIAETFWSINPDRGLVILWFAQQVDNHSWTTRSANLWAAARLAVSRATPPTATIATSGAANPMDPRTSG